MITNHLMEEHTTSGTYYKADYRAGSQYRCNVVACERTGCSPYTTALYVQPPGGVSVPATPTNASPGNTSSPGFFFQAEDGIRGHCVTGVQTCALPIYAPDP